MSGLDELGARRAQWVAVLNAGNLDAYAALLADDVVWIPPGAPALDGRDEVCAWLAPLFAEFEYDLMIDDVEVRVAGEWAVERGAFTSRLRARSGGEWRTHRGLYFLLWKHRNGDWYIGRYVDVTDLFHTPDAR